MEPERDSTPSSRTKIHKFTTAKFSISLEPRQFLGFYEVSEESGSMFIVSGIALVVFYQFMAKVRNHYDLGVEIPGFSTISELVVCSICPMLFVVFYTWFIFWLYGNRLDLPPIEFFIGMSLLMAPGTHYIYFASAKAYKARQEDGFGRHTEKTSNVNRNSPD